MRNRKPGSKSQPFPRRRPEIVIAPSRAKPFAVDCRELPWWHCVAELGESARWAIYDPPGWRVTEVTEMTVTRSARVHEVDGVEIGVDAWEPDAGWQPGAWTMYARLTDDAV